MITSDLRVAVVGLGARSVIGHHVATARPGSTVTAVADPTPQGRERGRLLFPGAAVHPDHTALLAAGGIDAAVVTTPDHTHADIAVDLLRAGVA